MSLGNPANKHLQGTGAERHRQKYKKGMRGKRAIIVHLQLLSASKNKDMLVKALATE